jgi:hypothetical protein
MANGFLYDVKALVDKASFAEGIREIQKLEQTSKKLIAGISGISASVVGTATIAGEVATQELRVAKAIGVSSEALSSWKVAANVAGASASGLIGTLSALENKMQHLKTGTVDSALAKNLGMLGVGYGDFADMDAESRMRTVFNQADQMEDQKLAATLVGDILGQAGRDYYDSLKLSGKTIDQQLAEARKLNFVSNQNRKEAALFASEIRSVKEAGKSITMLFGTEIASALTPTVRTIKTYLINNRDAIRRGITGFAQQTATVFNAIAGAIVKVTPVITGLIDKFGGLDKILVKVGVGFASFKLVQFAGGIRSLISGIGLLKASLGGLAMGGIGLVLEDIAYHFMGGGSLLFDVIIPKLKEIKDELGIDVDFGKVADGIKKMADALGSFATSAVKNTITLLKDLGTIFKDLISGNWDKLGADMTKYLKDMKKGLEEVFNVKGVKATAKKAYTDTVEKGGTKVEAAGNAVEKGFREVPIIGGIYGWAYDKALEITGQKVEDGIISPSGKITQVSPQDWVFAVKDIADLAGGLMPSGINTTNNNMNAPANYVINQSFNIGAGVRASEVRTQAYKGTAEALQSNLSNASRIMQLMPGTR